jgi:hypothetical protein
MVYAGQAPKRPRNGLEAEAMRGRNGRRPSPNSKVQQAAMLVLDLIRSGESREQAIKAAAAAWGCTPSNVRRYAHRLLDGPTVDVSPRGWAAQLMPKVQAPLVVDPSTVEALFPDAMVGDQPDG